VPVSEPRDKLTARKAFPISAPHPLIEEEIDIFQRELKQIAADLSS
jgi:hypothetical protein